MTNALEQLDALIDELRLALAREYWEGLLRLNESVRRHVEPVMEDLARGDVASEVVAERLQALQEFVEAGQQKAGLARDSLRTTLGEVSRNRTAAQTYQTVSSRRSR